MTNNQLTRERLEKIKSWRDTYGAGSNVMLPAEEAEELACLALAAMDSEPVAWINGCNKSVPSALRYLAENPRPIGGESSFNTVHLYQLAREIELMAEAPLYRHAQPAKGLELAGWQFKSVNGDWLGLIDEHGKNQAVREGCEVREVFAMADGVNERDQVRREHAEWSQSTFGNVGPVGPLKHLSKEALEAAAEPDDLSEWADMQFLLWDAQRRAGITDEQIIKAMIEKLAVNKARVWPEPKDGEPRLHIKEQPAPVVPKEWTIADAVKFCRETGRQDAGAAMDAFNACRAAMLQAGNSPVIPDGYMMVPMRLTAENGAKGSLSGEFSETKFVNCPECFGDDECETCDGSGRIEITVPVTWTTIKEIWAKGAEHFAAAPQENI